MGKQVVAFQAVMEMMGQTFPGAFSGYSLRVVESHQSTKKDTSGTAKVGPRASARARACWGAVFGAAGANEPSSPAAAGWPHAW
jgi:hypothetical protein